jgi:polysaccharide biosynthesis/export protein
MKHIESEGKCSAQAPKNIGSAGILILASLILAAACAPQGRYVWVDNYTPSRGTPEGYVASIGDLLNVQVFDNDKLSSRARVRTDGSISLPLLSDVPVLGKTPARIAREVEILLKEQNLILNPHVNVVVDEVKPVNVSVLGAVGHAGRFSLEPGAGLAEALASAGGLNDFAHKDRIFVLRNAPERVRIRFTFDALTSQVGRAPLFRLQDGDVIVVD